MLKQLRRMERTQKSIIIGFALLMAVSLVVFYAPGRSRGNTLDPAHNPDALAKVNGDPITVADLTTQKQSMLQRVGGQFSLAQIGFTDKRFLDDLIRSRVTAQEAVRLGFSVSDAEVADNIRKQFNDPATGKFVGLDRYREIVTSKYGDIDRFEREIRDGLAAQKLQAFVTAGVRVSDEEVQDDYKRRNTTFDLTYVPVTADKLAQKIQPTDQELRAYYEQRKTDYRILEPQKKIRYLYIDQAKVGEKLQIPDNELREEYDKLAPEQKQAGIKVQQIVLKVARADLDAQVLTKAKELATKARTGENGIAPENVFADLAKGNSEDPATAKNGGTLPFVVKKNPAKPDDPYQKVLDIQPSTVLDPVKYKDAYYILRRGDVVPKTFEDAKQELLVSLRNRRGYAAAAKIAERAQERLKETKDVQKVAQELAADANMKPADMVRTTPYVKPGDDVPEIGSSPQFEQGIAMLNNPNDIGERTPIKGGFSIPMLVDKKEPRIPDFDEVKDKVTQGVRQERARAQLEEKARELASNAKGPGDLKAAAEKLGLQAQTSNDYKLGSPLGEAGTAPVLDEAIYDLKAGEVTKMPIKVGDNWVVVGATKRTEADLTEFAKQRDQLTQSMLSTRRDAVFRDYIASTQARFQHEGKIKIYKDVLKQLEEDEPPAAAPPQMPQMPTRRAPRPPVPSGK